MRTDLARSVPIRRIGVELCVLGGLLLGVAIISRAADVPRPVPILVPVDIDRVPLAAVPRDPVRLLPNWEMGRSADQVLAPWDVAQVATMLLPNYEPGAVPLIAQNPLSIGPEELPAIQRKRLKELRQYRERLR